MNIRIYPRVRRLLPPKEEKWGEFQSVDLVWLIHHLKNYWPMLGLQIVEDHLETDQIDDWFYQRYMQLYDHTLLIEGKWRNGSQKLSS